jgi:hypothetical protein
MSGPSLSVLRIIGTGDPLLFEHLLADHGLQVLGMADDEPLNKAVTEGVVAAIATTLTEDVHDYAELSPHQERLKALAESLGYVVGLMEWNAQLDMGGGQMNPQTARWYMLAKKLMRVAPQDPSVQLLQKLVTQLDNLEARAARDPSMAQNLVPQLTNNVRMLVVQLVKQYPVNEGLNQHPGTEYDPLLMKLRHPQGDEEEQQQQPDPNAQQQDPNAAGGQPPPAQ